MEKLKKNGTELNSTRSIEPKSWVTFFERKKKEKK